MTARAYDVVVVGGGAVGLMAARQLIQAVPDLRIAVLSWSQHAGASAAAGAMLGCFGEITATSTASAAGRARFALQLTAHEAWPGLVDALEEGGAKIRMSEGSYLIANARGGVEDSENYAAILRHLVEHGEPHSPVDAVPGLNPHPAARPLSAVFLQREGSVDATALLAALRADLVASGVQLREVACSRVLTAANHVTGVELEGGEGVSAAHVVLATGSYTSALLEASFPGHKIQPVLAGSGVATVADRVLGSPFRWAVRTVNRAGSCGLHLVPLGGGREYVGATNVIFREPETRPHLGVLQFLSESALSQLDTNLSYSRIEAVRVGNRPVTLDTFPLMGPALVDGLTILSGGYRDGLHASPAIADLTAAWIIEQRDAFPTEFQPERKPISTMTVDESIDAFCRQQVGSAVEAGAAVTPFMTFDDLAEVFRPRARELYERLGVSGGLHPDIVNYLCLSRKSDADVEATRSYLAGVGA